jgi:hypothetical protein
MWAESARRGFATIRVKLVPRSGEATMWASPTRLIRAKLGRRGEATIIRASICLRAGLWSATHLFNKTLLPRIKAWMMSELCSYHNHDNDNNNNNNNDSNNNNSNNNNDINIFIYKTSLYQFNHFDFLLLIFVNPSGEATTFELCSNRHCYYYHHPYHHHHHRRPSRSD